MRSPAMAPRFLDQNEVQGPRERAHCGPEAHLCIISMQYGVWEYNIYRTLFAALQYVPSQCGGARGRGATRRARAGRAAPRAPLWMVITPPQTPSAFAPISQKIKGLLAVPTWFSILGHRVPKDYTLCRNRKKPFKHELGPGKRRIRWRGLRARSINRSAWWPMAGAARAISQEPGVFCPYHSRSWGIYTCLTAQWMGVGRACLWDEKYGTARAVSKRCHF